MATAVLTAIFSMLAGMASGLFGIGGGVILVPVFYYLRNVNLHVAIGTSLAVIVPTALVAAFRHAGGNLIDWRLFFFASLFSILGGFLGANLSVRLEVDLLRKLFAVCLMLMALRMFLE